MENDEMINVLDDILTEHHYSCTKTIAILQDIQHKYHYLPKEAIEYTAKKLCLSEAKLYGIATFYENFSLKPKGKYVIRICDGTACHVKKSTDILNACMVQLNLNSSNSTTDDMLFTLETVSCLGACALSPVLTINDRVYPSMTPEKVKSLIVSIKESEDNDYI